MLAGGDDGLRRRLARRGVKSAMRLRASCCSTKACSISDVKADLAINSLPEAAVGLPSPVGDEGGDACLWSAAGDDGGEP